MRCSVSSKYVESRVFVGVERNIQNSPVDAQRHSTKDFQDCEYNLDKESLGQKL